MAEFMRTVGSILPNIMDVVRRFVVSVSISLGLTLLVLWQVSSGQEVDFLSAALITLFFASVGVTLFSEHRGDASVYRILMAVAVCVFLASVFIIPEDVYLTAYMMPVAMVLIASTVAYVGHGNENRSYWLFNHNYWFSLFIAFLGSLLIAGLVSVLIAAFSLLFDVNIKTSIYQYSLIISMFFIGPLFWLSLLPTDFNEQVLEGEPVEFTSKVTALFIRYVFVPFFLLFALLFHGVAVKFLLQGNLPAGQVGWYGFVLITAGIGSYLMAFPTRDVSGPLVSFFTKYWMWCLLVPLGLMITAYYIRLDEYGMTPLRYYLTGFLVWAIILVAYALWLKWRGGTFDLRVIALLAGVIIGLSSVGPWGAEAVSTVWQKQKLVADLTTLDLLLDGKVVKPLPVNPDGEGAIESRVQGQLYYFSQRNRGEQLLSLLSPDSLKEVVKARTDGKKLKGQRNRVYLAVNKILRPLSKHQRHRGVERGRSVTYRINLPFGYDLPAAGKVYGPISHRFAFGNSVGTSAAKTNTATDHHGAFKLVFKRIGDELVVKDQQVVIARFQMADLLELAIDHHNEGNPKKMTVREVKGTGPEKLSLARLIISSLTYQMLDEPGNKLEISSVNFWLFVAR